MDVDAGGKGQTITILGKGGLELIADLGLKRLENVCLCLDIISSSGFFYGPRLAVPKVGQMSAWCRARGGMFGYHGEWLSCRSCDVALGWCSERWR